MKLIALGDTHGRLVWKDIVKQDFDLLVFIGDYFDSFDIPFEQQLNNFLDICQYKRDNMDKVILLTGNHDFHYTPTAMDHQDIYSGFQHRNAWPIRHALEANKDIMQMAFQWNEWVFTHAGITATWIKGTTKNLKAPKWQKTADHINEVYKNSPRHFLFSGLDGTGDDTTQSPIWVRPRSLMRNAFAVDNIKQVVGHTRARQIGVFKDLFFLIDTLEEKEKPQYLVITEDGYEIKDVYAEKNTTEAESETSEENASQEGE